MLAANEGPVEWGPMVNKIDCPICGGHSNILDVVRTINTDSNIEVELRSCESCGQWWHNPVPDQETLNVLYESSSPYVVSAGARDSYVNKTAPDEFQEYVLKEIRSESGNYLEIGAGGGGLLRCFRARNYVCYGVDPGQWVQDAAIFSRLADVPADVRFDIFVLQDVLEHILDPLGLLRDLKNRANDHAVFFCSVPCNDSRPARTRKGKWAMVRPYGHLHYFSRKSVEKMFAFADLEIEDSCLRRPVQISKLFSSLKWRALIYEWVVGGRDQIYARAAAK